MDTQCHYNMNIHEGDEIQDQDQATSMEDRTLPLLHDSMIDQEIHEAKVKKKGGRRHKAQWLRRPMAVSDVILEFYEDGLRENAMRCLGNHLNEAGEIEVIRWALKNNIINVCLSAMDIGSELSKVIAMHIMESILRSSLGITHVCEPPSSILGKLVEMYKQTILVLVREEEFSPRLLFHVIRCCILLCKHCRALELLKENLPPPLLDDTFHEITKEFPVIKQLQNQLLLNLGKLEDIQVMDKPKMDHKIAPRNSKSISLSHGLNPLSPVNMNKENWSSPASPNLIVTYVGKEN